MASCMVQVSPLFKKLADINSKYILGCVRNASRVGPSRKSIPKRYGPKIREGGFVNRGAILVHQPRLRFCPGLNTGYSKGFIYAKVAGRVIVTCDKTNFIEEHPIVVRDFANQTVMWKKYYHVIPEPEHQNFKLVDTN